MSTIDFKLAAARPSDVRPNAQFTEIVMNQITSRKYSSRINTLFHRSPAIALLTIIAAIALISGTAYAVSYLWPRLHPSISQSHQSNSGRTSVLVTDCDKIDLSKRYELKKGAPISEEKINDVVKARCELNTISDWASKMYTTPRNESQPNNKPGTVRQHTTITPAMFAVQLVGVNENTMTVRDGGSLQVFDVNLSPETRIIVGGRYAKLAQLSVGDAVAYVSKDTVTTKNQATCTDQKCQADIISSTEQLLAVVKLTYDFDVYRSISSLIEVPVCAGNPVDECPGTSSIDIYQSTVDSPTQFWAEIAGKIVSYDDQSLTLLTTSGREVVVYTPWNLINSFNTDQSSTYGITIEAGDTLSVTYNQMSKTTNDSEISWKRLQRVRLLMEAESKAGPFHKY